MTHMAAGAALGAVAGPKRRGLLFWVSIFLASVLPDFDVIAFALGIPYAHPLGHRGFSHSLVFAVLTGILFALPFLLGEGRVWRRYWHMVLVIGGAAALHGLLDAMTTGGLGIGFFIPLDDGRYFLPQRPIKVSPIGLNAFLSSRGLAVFKSELYYVWLPSIVIITASVFVRRLPSFKKR